MLHVEKLASLFMICIADESSKYTAPPRPALFPAKKIAVPSVGMYGLNSTVMYNVAHMHSSTIKSCFIVTNYRQASSLASKLTTVKKSTTS